MHGILNKHNFCKSTPSVMFTLILISKPYDFNMVAIYPNQICVITKEGYQSIGHMMLVILHTRYSHSYDTRSEPCYFLTILTLWITLSFCQQREVKRCLFPTCLTITVNLEKVREVFVADCQVTVTGDTNIFKIAIKDSNGLNCG